MNERSAIKDLKDLCIPAATLIVMFLIGMMAGSQTSAQSDLSLRDQFAVSIVSGCGREVSPGSYGTQAALAYQFADALTAARNR